MPIRARAYKNRKDSARVQVTMDLDEAKQIVAGKLNGELKDALKEAIKQA